MEAVVGEEQERQLPAVPGRATQCLLVELEEGRSNGLIAVEELATGSDAVTSVRTLSVTAANASAEMVKARMYSSVPQ